MIRVKNARAMLEKPWFYPLKLVCNMIMVQIILIVNVIPGIIIK